MEKIVELARDGKHAIVVKSLHRLEQDARLRRVVVTHTFNPSTGEPETGGGQSALQSEF